MKSLPRCAVLALTALFASRTLAGADVVVTQHIEGGGQSGDQKIRVKDGRARADIGTAVSVIFDRQTGETTTLAHAQRGYLVLTPEAGRAMLEKMQEARGSQEAPKLVATGKKEKVGEYQCEIFTVDVGTLKLTYWLSKEYPEYQKFLDALDVVEGAPLASASAGVAPRTRELPGMPMKIMMERSGQKVTVTLLSAKEESVDPAIFKIPAGYKEQGAPSAPAKP
jgi:Domain of unknown function (DUF4412)